MEKMMNKSEEKKGTEGERWRELPKPFLADHDRLEQSKHPQTDGRAHVPLSSASCSLFACDSLIVSLFIVSQVNGKSWES